jgi:hypothetical protein
LGRFRLIGNHASGAMRIVADPTVRRILLQGALFEGAFLRRTLGLLWPEQNIETENERCDGPLARRID